MDVYMEEEKYPENKYSYIHMDIPDEPPINC